MSAATGYRPSQTVAKRADARALDPTIIDDVPIVDLFQDSFRFFQILSDFVRFLQVFFYLSFFCKL